MTGRIDYRDTALARKGRYEDRHLAHVAPGELVVPPVISAPLRAALFAEMADAGLDPHRYTVGGGMSVNPATGHPEFFFKKAKKLFRKAASVALPIAGAYFGGPIGAAAASAATTKINGGGWGDALKNAGLSAALSSVGGVQGKLTPASSTIGGWNSGLNSVFSPIGDAFSSATSGIGDALGLGGRTADGLQVGKAYTTGGDLPWQSSKSLSPTAGGGYQFGDFAAGKDVLGSGTFADSLANTAQTMGTASVDPWASGLGAATNPSTAGGTMGTFWGKAIDGLSDSFTSENMLGGLAKGGLGMALSRSPDGGFRQMQAAANANRELYAPYLETGRNANASLAGALGLTGEGGYQTALRGFRQGPGYQFARQQGIDALDASAARRGMLLSGNQVQAVQDYGTGLADQEFDQYLGNLRQQAGVGYQAAGDTGSANMYAAQAEAMRKKARGDNFNGFLANALFPSNLRFG